MQGTMDESDFDSMDREHLDRMFSPIYYEVHDDLTNKTLHIKANDLEEAIGISDTLDFNDFDDGDYVDVLDSIDNYVE